MKALWSCTQSANSFSFGNRLLQLQNAFAVSSQTHRSPFCSLYFWTRDLFIPTSKAALQLPFSSVRVFAFSLKVCKDHECNYWRSEQKLHAQGCTEGILSHRGMIWYLFFVQHEVFWMVDVVVFRVLHPNPVRLCGSMHLKTINIQELLQHQALI